MRQFFNVIGCAVVAGALLGPASGLADPVTGWQADRAAIVSAENLARDDFTWVARPVIVFADSPRDPRFAQQLEILAARPGDLAERDVVVITDANPNGRSALREDLRPRGFMVAILAKDGTVAARKPTPRSLREITRQIDSMPLRQQEMRERRGGR